MGCTPPNSWRVGVTFRGGSGLRCRPKPSLNRTAPQRVGLPVRSVLREGAMRLKDRVAIVTGAALGIGQTYCLALAREGARVVATDILPCVETVAKVQQAGG